MADGTAQSGSEEDDEEYVPQNDADFEKLTTEDALDGDVYLLNGSKTTGRQSGAKRKSDQSVASSVLEQIKERKRARKAKEQDATIDAIWASMNQGNNPKPNLLAALSAKNVTKKKKKKKKKHGQKKKLKLSNLLRGMSNNNNVARATSIKGDKIHSTKKDMTKISEAALAAARAAKSMEKVTVTKVVKFANKVTEVTHTVEAGTEAARSRGEKTSTTKRVSALDTIIDGLKGPTTVSTVEKTSFDWEKYKTEKGITEDVEKYTKDGYLTKQDFLNRVDLRQFEMEKKERELQRIKRDAELARSKKRR